MSLKDKAIKCNGVVLEFMEGRENGGKMKNKSLLTIVDFGFLMGSDDKTGEQKEYSSMIFKEDNENFFFGGAVVTPRLKELYSQMDDEDHAEMLSVGIPVIFEVKKSRANKGQTYTTCEFYPSL